MQTGVNASLNGLLTSYSNQPHIIVAIVKNYPASFSYAA